MQKLIWGEYYRHDSGRIVRYVPFHEGQQKIMDSKARFLFYIGGKGCAKSSTAPLWLDREIRKTPKGKFIVCAPNYKFLEQGIYPEFMKHFDSEYNDLKGKWQEQKKGYVLSTGGIVYFRSLDDPESVNGIHANAICCDEAGYIPLSAWHILESRVSAKLGKILVTTTPYRKYKWIPDIVELSKTDKNYYVLQMPSTINPSVSSDEFERLRKTMPDWKFRQDYCGEFTKPAGVIYPELETCVVKCDKLPSGRLFGAIDWGHGKAQTAALVGILDNNDCLWIFWEYYKQQEFIQAAKDLKSWHNALIQSTGKEVSRWFCDSATDTWKSLKRYKIDDNDTYPRLNARPAKKGAGSVEYGIDLVTARIRLGKLKIIEGKVKAVLEEADEYRYDVDEDNTGSSRIVGSDHALDALRYLILSLDRKRQLQG